MPIPNFIGVNGDAAKKMYLNGGYPQERLFEVEALRYQYLSTSTTPKIKRKSDTLKKKVVLVVGEYLKENTDKQLDLLLSAFTDIDQSTYYIIKPHPACPINMKDLLVLPGEISMKPIAELLKISDVVYSSTATSAAVDDYCAGLPFITFLDGKALNQSPLRGYESVYFVSNAKDLATAINNVKATDSEQGKKYFYLDLELIRWRKWLTDSSKKANK